MQAGGRAVTQPEAGNRGARPQRGDLSTGLEPLHHLCSMLQHFACALVPTSELQ
jgi:hypothetical protein